MTALAPRIGISLSAASIPFCKGITAVSGPISGLICSPALSRSHSFTQNSTTSTLPMVLGSSVAWVGARCVSPRGLSILRPALSMAARCAPRAMKVTSAPAFASAAPKPPPTPPAPTTAIFIPFSHQSKLDADFALMLRKRNAFVLASCRRALQNDQTMDISELDRLTRWLMEGARSAPTPTTFLKEMCERLVAAGLPLYRAGAFVQTLHPDVFGRSFIWREGAEEVVVNTANFDLPDSPRFKNSPLAILYASGHEVRYRLDDPESRRFPFFDDMRGEGVTDYIALPLFFMDGSTHASSWTTRAAGGFTDEQLAALRSIIPPFARVGEIFATRRTAAALLDTYVGNRAGERILGGQIRRGHAE